MIYANAAVTLLGKMTWKRVWALNRNSSVKCFAYLACADVLGVKGSYSPHRQIPWAMGFKSARASESESDLSEKSNTVYFVKGYDSAVTATVTDSEDDLFFLSGE